MIEIEIPERNIIVEFPEGTPENEIQRAIKQDIFGEGDGQSLAKEFGRGIMHGLMRTGESVGTGMEYLGHRAAQGPQRYGDLTLTQRADFGQRRARYIKGGFSVPDAEVKAFADIRGNVQESAADTAQFMIEQGDLVSKYWGDQSKKWGPPKEIEDKNVWDNPELLKSPVWWAYNTGDMVPSLAAAMVPATGTYKGIKAIGSLSKLNPQTVAQVAKLGAAVTGGVVGGALEGSATYRSVLERGGTEEEAARAAELMGFFSAGLNSISVGTFLRSAAPGFVRRVAHLGLSSVVDAVTEGVEEPFQVVSIIGSKIMTGQDVPENVRDLFFESLKDAVSVAPVAGLTGLLGGAGGQVATETEVVADESQSRIPQERLPQEIQAKQAAEDLRNKLESSAITYEQAKALRSKIPDMTPFAVAYDSVFDEYRPIKKAAPPKVKQASVMQEQIDMTQRIEEEKIAEAVSQLRGKLPKKEMAQVEKALGAEANIPILKEKKHAETIGTKVKEKGEKAGEAREAKEERRREPERGDRSLRVRDIARYGLAAEPSEKVIHKVLPPSLQKAKPKQLRRTESLLKLLSQRYRENGMVEDAENVDKALETVQQAQKELKAPLEEKAPKVKPPRKGRRYKPLEERNFRQAVINLDPTQGSNKTRIDPLNFKGEVKELPLASRRLFKKGGMPYDQAIQTLEDAGHMPRGSDFSTLTDVLRDANNLKRGAILRDTERKDEEISEQEREYKEQLAHEPEAPPEGEYTTVRAEDLPEGAKLTLIDGKSKEGWDVYEVAEKDPFEITLIDGEKLTLKPHDKVQVLKTEVEKPKLELKGEKETAVSVARLKRKKREQRKPEQETLTTAFEEAKDKQVEGLRLEGEQVSEKEREAFEKKKIEREPTLALKKKAESKTINRDTLEQSIQPLLNKWQNKPNIHVLSYTAELPRRQKNKLVKANIAPNAKIAGLIDGNNVYLIASSFDSVESGIESLFHEVVGHWGIDKVLPDGMLREIYNSKKSEIKEANKLHKFDMGTRRGRELATKEWIAQEATANPESTWVQRVVDAIKKFLAKLGVKIDLADAHVRGLIANSRRYVEDTRKHRPRVKVFGEMPPVADEPMQFSLKEDEETQKWADEYLKKYADLARVEEEARYVGAKPNAYKKGKAELYSTIESIRDSRLVPGGFVENVFRTIEWAQDPQRKEIFQATQEREQTKHKVFHDLDTSGFTGKKTTDLWKSLKYKGKSRLAQIRGYDLFDRDMSGASEDYKEAWKIIDDMDTTGYKWEHYRPVLKKQGVSEDILEVVDHQRWSYDSALDMMRANLKEVLDAYEQAGEDAPVLFIEKDKKGKKKKYTLQDAYNEMGKLKGFYAPRIREDGEFAVLSLSPDGQPFRYHKPNRRKAYKLKALLKEQGHTDIKVEPIEKLPESIYQDLTIGEVSKALEFAVEKIKGVDADTQAKIRIELITAASDMMKARAFRAHRIARRTDQVVKGYIEDPGVRHLLYTHRIAGGIAKGEAAIKMFDALQKIDAGKEKQLYDTTLKYVTEQLKNPDKYDKMVGMAKSVVSFKYLGLSPRAMGVNVTALLTTVPPAIHQYALEGRGSLTAIGRALTKAGRDYSRVMRGQKLRNADEQAFMDAIQESGYDNPQYMRDALGEIHNMYGSAWKGLMDISMKGFGITEQWNRGSTMLAAYRLARKKGKPDADARKLAQDASNKAHGVYGRATLPMFAMGSNPFAKVAQMGYTYQKFPHNYVQMLFDLGFSKKNLKALSYALAAPAVIGGFKSSLVASGVFAIIKGIMVAIGDDREPEKMVYDTIREEFSQRAERIARYGLFGGIGIDLSGSLAVGMEVPRTIMDLTGPFGGAYQDITQSAHYLRTGQPLRSLEKALPSFAANLVRAVRELDGVTTRSGNRVWDDRGRPYVPTKGESAWRTVGFRSSKQATAGARKWESQKEISRFQKRRNRIYEEYRAYLVGGAKDRDKLNDILEKIRDYNDKVIKGGRHGVIPLIRKRSMIQQIKKMQRASKRERAMLK